ncbi:hypothetical protein NEMBOFW57_005589 [Staphylotrichum longicolle]|uniref:F-box domain-containing protein n=1 Tax=Staphylotrichum longicolle TaxID=669026 RepID=A0AAD4EXS5_9PEZI|nr:hypothetical protein NEMBOFW57_005589 [Staphylotrichum longicolle]
MPIHSLPAELLLHILSRTPSVTALFALATTCRRLYSLFQSSQASLLYSVLAAELGPVLPDALGLAHSEVLDGSRGASRARYIAGIDAALDAYGGYLAGERDGLSEQTLELDEVLRLVRAFKTVGWVAGLYERCMMGLFENEVRPACNGSEESARAVVAPLSLVERLRVLRAFYRLQMALHIWGSSAVGMRIRDVKN